MANKKKNIKQNVLGYYRAERSYFANAKAFIAEGAICQLVEEITVRPRKPLVKKYLYVQGCLQRLASFQKLFDDNVLQEVEAPSEEFINDWIREPSSLKTLRENIENLQKEIGRFLGIPNFATLTTWGGYSKGNTEAATQKEEKAFQNNTEKVLKETVLRGGMKAKPGGAHKNRSLRTTPACNEDRWMKDETTLLANGIKEEERASFSEQEKILLKLVQEVANMYDCPDEILCLIEKDFDIKKQGIHYDYYGTYKPISIQEFCKNEHHSKTNGLEFCHINPSLQNATNVDNVTIGTCSGNRMQGGYTIEQHFKTSVGYAIRNGTFESWYADVLKQEVK